MVPNKLPESPPWAEDRADAGRPSVRAVSHWRRQPLRVTPQTSDAYSGAAQEERAQKQRRSLLTSYLHLVYITDTRRSQTHSKIQQSRNLELFEGIWL